MSWESYKSVRFGWPLEESYFGLHLSIPVSIVQKSNMEASSLRSSLKAYKLGLHLSEELPWLQMLKQLHFLLAAAGPRVECILDSLSQQNIVIVTDLKFECMSFFHHCLEMGVSSKVDYHVPLCNFWPSPIRTSAEMHQTVHAHW